MGFFQTVFFYAFFEPSQSENFAYIVGERKKKKKRGCYYYFIQLDWGTKCFDMGLLGGMATQP